MLSKTHSDCQEKRGKPLASTGTLDYNIKVNQGRERDSSFPFAYIKLLYFRIVTEYKLLTLREVEEITGVSKSKIYRDKRAGLFPKPLRLGKNCVRWRTDDIVDWISCLKY